MYKNKHSKNRFYYLLQRSETVLSSRYGIVWFVCVCVCMCTYSRPEGFNLTSKYEPPGDPGGETLAAAPEINYTLH